MHPWLTNSLLILCGAVALFSIWVADKTTHPRWKIPAKMAVPLQLLALVGAYFVLRPGASDDLRATIVRSASTQHPVFIAFHSNFCGACLYARPAVDSLAHDLEGQAEFARLNIDDADAAKLFRKHQFRAVPAFLVLDANGSELYRQEGGTPDHEAVVAALEALRADKRE
jgi:thiol-disulfide isomerase/thioredoxin